LKRAYLLLIVIFLFASTKMWAQDPFVQHFTTSEGLLSNTVYKVFQDSKKIIWFATDAGVSRYDGTKFNSYRKQEGLSSNDIINIKEDSFGRIWFFHNINSTLNFFYNNTIYNEANTPFLDSLSSNDNFRSFYEDTNGNLFFYNHPERLIFELDLQNHVNKYQLDRKIFMNKVVKRLEDGMSVQYMKKDVNGEFIFWTPRGCYKTRNLSESPVLINEEFQFQNVITASNNRQYAIVREKDSIQFRVKRFHEEYAYDKAEAICPATFQNVYSILEDNEGLLWISTLDDGVYCFKNDQMLYHFDIKDARSIIQDHEKNIWITSLKEGIYKISPFFNLHTHFGPSQFQNSGILALGQHIDKGVWCTNGELIYLLRENDLFQVDFKRSDKAFNQILQATTRLLMVGETGKAPYILKDFRINEVEKKILIGKVKRAAFSTRKISYNQQKNQISTYDRNFLYLWQADHVSGTFKMKKTREKIHNIHYDTNNELIINSKNCSVFKGDTKEEIRELAYFDNKVVTDHLNLDNHTELFNIEGDSLFLFSSKQIYNLSAIFEQPVDLAIRHLVYKDSTLFIATYRNLYVCKNPLNILKKNPVELNLIDINFKSIHDMLIEGDRLYIASDDGLSVLPYNKLKSSLANSPIPYFNSIQVNDQENLVHHKEISLSTNQRVNISFGCINYSVSRNIFSYKLEDSDNEWIEVKGNNVVLQNLPKGKYIFKLRARKPASNWSEPVEFGIKVNATIWQHPLFYFLMLLLIAVMIFLLILRKKNSELAHRQMEHQILLLEQKSHQAMMNPHFIFNVLGSIQNYLLRNQPQEAGIYLAQFARLIRQNLNALDTSMIKLEEEISRLKDYLDLEKLRLGDKFDYSVEVNEAAESEEILIPSMIIQPFVENAIWHGIANLEAQGFISISIMLHNEKSLQIIVEDTGVGIKNAEKYNTRSEEHLKMGMSITKKRLALLSQKYGIETAIEYSEKDPGATNPGTRVVIFVPFLFGNSVANNSMEAVQ